jgi:hypothetical protein
MPHSSGLEANSGGFLQHSSLSPALSATSASTATPSVLPHQRTHPLRPGSMKEEALINYIDKRLLMVNRRHAKKFSRSLGQQEQMGDERGYESFREVTKDFEAIIDILWVSGSRMTDFVFFSFLHFIPFRFSFFFSSLYEQRNNQLMIASIQIPHLISLTGLINTYLPNYPFSPRPTFRLLEKLDLIFASLLLGEDAETGAPLSGFEGKRQVISITEKVRIKSIAETCRLAVVEARDREENGFIEDNDEMDLDTTSADGDDDDSLAVTEECGADAGQWGMELARIYEKTIQLLGDEFGKSELVL